MAKTVRVFLTCDLHGDRDQVDGVASVAFGYDGRLLELDLCHEHLSQFSDAISPWASVARPYGSYGGPPQEGQEGARRAARRPSTPRVGTSRERLAAIREWAKAQGMEVSDRGRIPASVMQAYEHRSA